MHVDKRVTLYTSELKKMTRPHSTKQPKSKTLNNFQTNQRVLPTIANSTFYDKDLYKNKTQMNTLVLKNRTMFTNSAYSSKPYAKSIFTSEKKTRNGEKLNTESVFSKL
jgi:hypothetical protein